MRCPTCMALADLVRAIVREELRSASASPPAEVSSVRLPPDAKSTDAFNRACRTGRVVGATKRGRIWTCSRSAWDARKPAGRPAGIADRPGLAKCKAKTTPKTERGLPHALKKIGLLG